MGIFGLVDWARQQTAQVDGGESVRQKMKEPAILSGSVARTFWLHTLIHTPYAPASCVRTDASSLAHYRLAKLARTARAEAKGVHHRDALGLDRLGEYPAVQAPLRVSAHSYIRNGDYRARRREQRRLWVLPKSCRRWLAGRCSACRLSRFGLAAELERTRARKWYN